jgi:hypothetical protein
VFYVGVETSAFLVTCLLEDARALMGRLVEKKGLAPSALIVLCEADTIGGRSFLCSMASTACTNPLTSCELLFQCNVCDIDEGWSCLILKMWLVIQISVNGNVAVQNMPCWACCQEVIFCDGHKKVGLLLDESRPCSDSHPPSQPPNHSPAAAPPDEAWRPRWLPPLLCFHSPARTSATRN